MNRRPGLPEKLRREMVRFGVRGPGVVAVSGGPDSVALLRALVETSPDVSLTVAHLNHALRGEEGDADEEFVRALAAQLRLALRCDRIDVRAAAAGGNLEATARRVRYEWLTGVARVTGSAWVTVGHTADDQAETVLHRLLRGTGLQGLRGIAPRRPLAASVELIRPLLSVTRAEVMAYLERIGQPARLDATNLDLTLTRNRLRHDLLPRLVRDYNPGVVGGLGRLARQAAEAFPQEERNAAELLAQAEMPRAGPTLVFDREILAAANPSRLRAMFRLVWRRESWSAGRMSFTHWDRLAALVTGEAASLELPGLIRIRQRDRVVLVELRNATRQDD